MEIGSEFWINLADIDGGLGEEPSWLTNYCDFELTTTGRGALSLMLSMISTESKSVLLPDYICSSVITPFEEAGYDLMFYSINQKLNPSDLELLVNTQVGVFVHLGYFGFPTNDGLQEVIQTMKHRGTVIVEDVTHSLLSLKNDNFDNDFEIASIRKWFGVPCGGFLASKKYRIAHLKLKNHSHDFVSTRTKALLCKDKYIKSKDISLKKEVLNLLNQAENCIEKDLNFYPIDSLSKEIIYHTHYTEIATLRRNNYRYLLSHFPKHNQFKPIFNELNTGVVPLFFPISVKNDRKELVRALIQNDIYCPVHWPIPHQLGHEHKGNKVNEIYGTILSIPCDQRYSIKDMKRIIEVIKDFVKEV